MHKRLLLGSLTLALTLAACGQPQAPAAERPAPSTDTVQAQIVNGTASVAGARPYQVALLKNGSLSCGGSLIAQDWVMTAAHCVSSGSTTGLTVRAGSLYYASGGQTSTVSAVRVHPSYNTTTSANDIALLKLSTPMTLNSNVALGKIPGDTVEAVLDVKGKYAVVSGWGKTSGSGGISSVLREVSIPITPNPTTCGSDSPPANTICGEAYQGKDSCNGDSGGPLAQALNSKHYVLGIVSYGPSACNGYGVYTRVNGFKAWIQTTSGVVADNGDTGGGTNTAPVANFSSSVNGLSVSFMSTSTDAENNINAYSWNFGDGTSSTAANPSKTYSAAGTYTVTLTVTDAGGLTSTKTGSVTVSSSGGSATYSGSLASGAYAFQPGSTGTTYNSGTISATLTGPSTADFDLYLQKRNADGTWSYVVQQATSATTERVTYTAAAGTYRWIVSSYSGSGSYTLSVTAP